MSKAAGNTNDSNGGIIIQDPFWDENLYEVNPYELAAAQHLPPKHNPWGMIPFADPVFLKFPTDPVGIELIVYHSKGHFYHRLFRKEDVREMKRCALRWMVAIHNQSTQNIQEPWWYYNYWLQRNSEILLGSIVEPNNVSDKTLGEVWGTYLKFQEHQYICGRYHFNQGKLLDDLAKDYFDTSNQFFAGCETEYLQLLLRVVAAHLGYKLNNVGGD